MHSLSEIRNVLEFQNWSQVSHFIVKGLVLSIFTGSCFACGISLPLCFIIAQVPKQKKTHGTQFFQIDAAGLFSPLCAVHCFWCMRVLC